MGNQLTSNALPGLRVENWGRTRAEDVPILDIQFPRRANAIHQIEVTSECNLRCTYCIHPKMQRSKGHMEWDTYLRALEHAAHYMRGGTQDDLNLSGTGEPTLHPRFAEMLARAREVLGWEIPIIFPTNGVGYTEALVKDVARYKPRVWVSLHRPEKAGPAVTWWKRAGVFAGTSEDPVKNGNDWAGQVEWDRTQDFAMPCMWLRQGYVFVESTGDVVACCLDGDGGMKVGHVSDEIGSLRTQPGPLCAACHQVIGVKGLPELDENVVDERRNAISLPVVK